ITNGDGGVFTTTTTPFTVNAAPTFTSISPASRGQGSVRQVLTIVVSNFVSGAAVSFANAGITVNSTGVTDATHLSVNISISAGAPTRPSTHLITNGDGGVFTTTTTPFTVNAAPTFTSIS